MAKNYPLMIAGVASLLTLAPYGVAQALAQKVTPPVSLKPGKVTPAELKARLAESKAKHPLLHQRIMPSFAKRDSIVRLNHSIAPGVKMQQTPGLILKSNNEAVKTLWGNVLYDNTWDDYTTAYGMYKFETKAPISVSKQFGDDFFRATGAGAWLEDALYYVMYQSFWGVDMVYLYKYNTDTWTQEVEKRLEDFTMVANETAVAADGTVYGDFLDADGNYNELGIADYENGTRTTIGRLKRAYVAMGITSDDVLYGIGTDGNLYKIDTKTAEETLVGSTGVQVAKKDGSFFYQSGEIDQSTNTFYWDCVDVHQKSTLYTVDLATAQLTEIGEFANNNIISLLSIPKAKAADGAPAAPASLSFDFKEGSLTGNVCFTAPDKTFAGGTLEAGTQLSYSILVDKQEVATGTTTPGAQVAHEITLKSGYSNITVTVSNSEGKSPKTAARYYAGYDKPKTIGEVTTAIDTATGQATVTWEAPTAGENDGYVGGLTYDIVRYPDGKTVKTGCTETTFTETLEKGETQTYGYGVTANNHGVKSAETVSNFVAYGDPITPPFINSFEDDSEMAYFTVIDNNNDGNKWTRVEPSMSNDYDGYALLTRIDKTAFDDWMITPALSLKANHQYKISFRLSGFSKYYEEKFEVKYGATPTVAGMTETLMEATSLKQSDFDTRTLELTPTEDQVVYLGFHGLTEKSEAMGIKIDDVSVSAGVDLEAPDTISSLKVEAGENGALQANISFKAPSTQLNGGELSSITKFQLRRTGKIVAEIPAAAPGAEVTYTDDTATNGINIYSVTACNDKGAGFYCTPVPVYIGEDAPNAPVKGSTEDKYTSVRLNWSAPETGTHDGYVNPKNLTYTIATKGGSDYYPTYDAVGTSEGQNYYDYKVNTLEGSEQTVKTFYVNAANKYGESSYIALPSFVIGKPYDIPFSASVKDYKFYGILWTAWGTGTSDFDLSTESCDNDGGSFHVMPYNTEDIAYLGSGKINLGGATAPKLMFHHKAAEGSTAKITVEVETPDGKSEVAGVVDYANLKGGEWSASAVDLSKWANEKFITFDFAVQGSTYEDIYIDRLFVRDTNDDDLNAEIEAPESMTKGESAKVNVRVNNFGSNDAKKFSVSLYANDQLVETKKVTETLKAYDFTDIAFDYQSNVLTQDESVDLKAVVDYTYDLNEDDNTVSANVKFTVSNKPKPDHVDAEATTEGVKLTWTPVTSTSETTTDSFENYTSWSQNTFGNFTASANNSGTTGGVLDNYKFPNQGSNYAFMLFDPLNEWLEEDQLAQLPEFTAHSGSKYLASLYRVNDEGTAVNQDNWLISPELSGDKQQVSFWVKNVNDGDTSYPETFDVLYSTSDPYSYAFTKLGDTYTVADGKWKQITVELPAGTKYFAINQNTSGENAFVFMVDDVTYSYGIGEVKSYNIYRDGKKVGTVEATATSFVDEEIKSTDSNTYQYGVTAVFADAESEATLAQPITPTGIENIVATGKTFDVYTLEGICVAKNVKSLGLLKQGVYLVNGKKVVIE